MNSLSDFCMWSSSGSSSSSLDTVGDSMASFVAWCTKEGHGSRLIPSGAITGLQWLYAKSYVQLVGSVDQTKLHIRADDFGGRTYSASRFFNPLIRLSLRFDRIGPFRCRWRREPNWRISLQ